MHLHTPGEDRQELSSHRALNKSRRSQVCCSSSWRRQRYRDTSIQPQCCLMLQAPPCEAADPRALHQAGSFRSAQLTSKRRQRPSMVVSVLPTTTMRSCAHTDAQTQHLSRLAFLCRQSAYLQLPSQLSRHGQPVSQDLLSQTHPPGAPQCGPLLLMLAARSL